MFSDRGRRQFQQRLQRHFSLISLLQAAEWAHILPMMRKPKIADGIYSETADAEAAGDLVALGACLAALREIELSQNRVEPARDSRQGTECQKSDIALKRQLCLAKIERLIEKTMVRDLPSVAAQRTLASISKFVTKVQKADASADPGHLRELQALADLLSDRERIQSCLLH